jgi:dTDP-glucose 4,6-dehydratase
MYTPSSILMTGCCGFIGSNVLNYMAKKYPDVEFVNIDKMDYCSSLKNIDESPAKYTFYKCDIRDSAMIREIMRQHRIDTVIHFAAQTHVDNSFGNSIQFTMDNVLGTHTLLECCKEYGKIRRFVHISTDEVYGEVGTKDAECVETRVLTPTNPYAATKAAAEHLVFSYHHSFKLPVVVLRGNNVYGPRQYPEKLIPKFITLLNDNKKCTVHGEGKTIRNFIHVDDVSSAVDTILTKGIDGNIYNIGSKNEFSVMEIASKLIRLLKSSEDIHNHIEFVEDRNFNDFRYSISNDKLIQLGWRETVAFEEGLKHTVDWYLENSGHWN